jgi:hypothetical protein
MIGGFMGRGFMSRGFYGAMIFSVGSMAHDMLFGSFAKGFSFVLDSRWRGGQHFSFLRTCRVTKFKFPL